MDAQSALVAPLGRATAKHIVARPLQWAGFGLIVLLWFVALTLTLRRASGAMNEPLGTAAMFTAGLMTAAMTVAIRVLLAFDRRPGDTALLHAVLQPLPTLAVVVLGIAIWIPRTSPGDGLMFCIPPLIAETLLWRRALGGPFLVPRRTRGSRRLAVKAEKLIPSAPQNEPGDDIHQQLIRRRTIDGAETIDGWVRATLTAGQRTAWAHVAFCPPFGTMPQLSVTQQSGPRARVSIGRLLPYGARFDLKLATASDRQQTVLLSFTVRCRTSRAKIAG